VFNRTGTLTYGGVISGTGSLAKIGTSTLTLTGNNTYAGGTTINAGTLAVSSDANLGAASSGLTFGGGTLRFDAGFTLNRDVTLNSSGGTFNTSGNTATLGGTISGVGGLTKSGAGTLTLTGTNTYQGNTTISGGALAVSSDVNLGAATGTLNLRTGGALQFLANFTSDRNVTIGPGNAVFDTNGHDATLTGAISVGSGTTELHKIGAGTLTLTGNNTYTGQLQINAGTLILTGDNQPSITATPISSGATLQIGNGGGTGSLTGNVTADGLFIINRSNAYTFGGVISGAGSFVQMGAGTTTLAATNTYSGGTTISAGTLAVSADANLGNTSGALSFGGGTLQYLAGFTSNRGVTLNAGGGTFDTNGNDATLLGTIRAAAASPRSAPARLPSPAPTPIPGVRRSAAARCRSGVAAPPGRSSAISSTTRRLHSTAVTI
jgi:autotransporter-associated beta strand protein